MKKEFLTILSKIKRTGLDKTIKGLEELGFFEAPASTKFHGAYPGGLIEHSLNVYTQAMYLYKIECKLRPDLKDIVSEDNVIIASLFHDVCKSEVYQKVKKWVKDNVNNKWEEKEVYEKIDKDLPVGHGEKSVIRLLSFGLELTKDEILAIRWHMGGFDVSPYQDAKKGIDNSGDISPLVPIIQCADLLASRITETRGDAQNAK